MMLSSLPGDADAMSLATTMPGTSYWVEPTANKVVWHFMRQSGEYGRYVVELSEAGSEKTRVTTHFEDGPADPEPALPRRHRDDRRGCQRRRGAGGSCGRPQRVQAKIRERIASDPMASQVEVIEHCGRRDESDGPARQCKTGTPKEMNSWVCQKRGHTINGDTGVITESDTGRVVNSTDE